MRRSASPPSAAQVLLRIDSCDLMPREVRSSCAPGVHLEVHSLTETELTYASSRAFGVGDAGLDPTTSTV